MKAQEQKVLTKVEELEERIAPSAWLAAAIPAETGASGITTVPPDPAQVADAAVAADGAGGVVSVVLQ